MDHPSSSSTTALNGDYGVSSTGSTSRPAFIPSAPYTRRPPSPPTFNVPIPHGGRSTGADDDNDSTIAIAPDYDRADPTQVSAAELDIITDNRKQTKAVMPRDWTYEQRRLGSRILDFLHLGPNTVIRDLDYLSREGFTMVVVVRDTLMGARESQGLNRAVSSLGVQGYYADVSRPRGLIAMLDPAIRAINAHLLSRHRAALAEGGDPQRCRPPGKVLVTCESGNDRSANLVAAYIMAVYGRSVQTALHYINAQRFCCVYNDESKRVLQAWGDIVKARSTAARGAPGNNDDGDSPMDRNNGAGKRGFDEVDMDLDEGGDDERFMDREAFAPFKDL